MPPQDLDIPARVDALEQRLTALEQRPAVQPTNPTTATPVDTRVDVIYDVLERYFGKEMAEALQARLGPQNTGVTVQPGAPPQQTMQRPGLTETGLVPPNTPVAPQPAPFTPVAQPTPDTPASFSPPQPPVQPDNGRTVTVPPDNRFEPQR